VPNPADQVGLVAVTVLGDDRPGIVADVSSVLAELGCNLEDSTMTLLRGHFAMVVLVRTERSTDEVEASLQPLSAGGGLVVDVRRLPEHGDARVPGTAYTVHVHGADRPGIVAAMTNVVARHGGNIVDLGTRLGDGVYVLIAEFLLPPTVSIDAVEEDLARVAHEIGVDFHVSVVDDDLL
jgi:glycine cleavage system transcriptional repressor